MFGLVDALLFRPPSGVADPDRVARVQMQLPPPPNEPAGELSSAISYPDFVTRRDNTKGFAGAAAFAPTTASVGEGPDARNHSALLVSGDYVRDFLTFIVPLGCVSYFPVAAVVGRANRTAAPDWLLPLTQLGGCRVAMESAEGASYGHARHDPLDR
jgi:hypothetical protein